MKKVDKIKEYEPSLRLFTHSPTTTTLYFIYIKLPHCDLLYVTVEYVLLLKTHILSIPSFSSDRDMTP